MSRDAAERANLLERLISFISPRAGLRRYHARQALERAETYAAAKSGRLINGWRPASGNVNRIIEGSWSQVHGRVRQLVRDFPYFARAADLTADYVVGEGILFQSQVRAPEGGFDKAWTAKIEDCFKFWADEADAQGQLHFYEMMSLAKRQDFECGEFLLVKTWLKDPKRHIPFALQMIEPDWLTAASAKPNGKNVVDQGIEYRPATGQVVAYHVADPGGYAKPNRIPAERVIHGYHAKRPGQLRGISPMAPAVLVAHDLSDYMDSEIDGAKMAAKWLAFVERDDLSGVSSSLPGGSDASGAPIETLENGTIEYLRGGEKVTLASSPRPSSNMPPFVRLLLQMTAVTAGLPYELISGDYQGMSWANSRIVRNDYRHQLRPIIGRHVRHFATPIINSFFDAAQLAGKLNMPGYYQDLPHWRRCYWQPPGQEPVDPLREDKSNLEQMRAFAKSPQEIIQGRGRDPQEVLSEISLFAQMVKDAGLPDWFTQVADGKTALANNPAAVSGETGEAS